MRLQELSVEAIPYHDELNPVLWSGDHLKTEIRYKLLLIAKHFAKFLNVLDLNLRDITISGSNAAYGYTVGSDLDLHLVVDIPSDRPDLIELYDAKKNQYNLKYDIKIKDIPIELYVQDSKQPHTSAGIYSLLNDEWIRKPKHESPKVTEQEVKSKARNYAGQINAAIKSHDLGISLNVLSDLYRLRKAGLEEGGENSVENLAFKLLRSRGQLTKLKNFIDKLQSDELSLKEGNKK